MNASDVSGRGDASATSVRPESTPLQRQDSVAGAGRERSGGRMPGLGSGAAAGAIVVALACAPLAARAEVTGTATGFVVKHEAVVPLAPAAAYARLLRVQDWWDPAHTYSGKAENLSLAATPGGCWCETLPDGGFVEHMRVVLAMPGTVLRLHGALGPLQQLGVAGALTFTLKPEGEGTRVTMTYVVGGHATNGLDGLQRPVEAVLGAGLTRFAATQGNAAR